MSEPRYYASIKKAADGWSIWIYPRGEIVHVDARLGVRHYAWARSIARKLLEDWESGKALRRGGGRHTYELSDTGKLVERGDD